MAKPDLILIALEESTILMLMERILRVKYETRLLRIRGPSDDYAGVQSRAFASRRKVDGHEGIKAPRN